MLNKQQLGRLHILLKDAGCLTNKADVLAGVGVTSARDLTEDQYNTLVDTLTRLAANRKPASDEVRRKRSVILALCTEVGVWDGRDWKRLNAYMRQPRIAGKLLVECSMEELNALYKKLRLIASKANGAAEAQNEITKWN